jgi:hypothetical protein
MKGLIEKLADVCARIISEQGGVYVFALLLREEAPDRWDLVLSAPWADASRKESYDYIADRLRESLSSSDLVRLSRIVVVPPESPVVQSAIALMKMTSTGRSAGFGRGSAESAKIAAGATEFVDRDFGGMPIRRAFVFDAETPPQLSDAVRAAAT